MEWLYHAEIRYSSNLLFSQGRTPFPKPRNRNQESLFSLLPRKPAIKLPVPQENRKEKQQSEVQKHNSNDKKTCIID